MDWFDLLAIQEALKSLLKHHNLKASILQRLAFMVQLSHPHMTTGKTIALTIQIFVGKVVSLLLSALSRFFIACLSRSKHLLISWLQSLSTVILEPKEIKSVTVSIVSLCICHEVILEKAEKPEIKLPISAGSWKKQESSRKTSISAY